MNLGGRWWSKNNAFSQYLQDLSQGTSSMASFQVLRRLFPQDFIKHDILNIIYLEDSEIASVCICTNLCDFGRKLKDWFFMGSSSRCFFRSILVSSGIWKWGEQYSTWFWVQNRLAKSWVVCSPNNQKIKKDWLFLLLMYLLSIFHFILRRAVTNLTPTYFDC